MERASVIELSLIEPKLACLIKQISDHEMQMVHVMHYVPNFQDAVGGREVFVRGLVSHIDNLGLQQTVITSSPNGRREVVQFEKRTTVISLPAKKIGAYTILSDLLSTIAKVGPDLINVHGYGEYPGDVVCLQKKLGKLDKPLILTTHGIAGLKHAFMAFDRSSSFTPRQRVVRSVHLFYDFSMGRLQMNTFDRVILLSDEEKNYLSKIGLKYENSLKIPIAISDLFFGPPRLVDRNGILYVGRIDEFKGLDVLVKAIRELCLRNINLKCRIIGKDFNYKSRLQSLINRLDLGDLVSIENQVTQEEVLDYYDSALVTVLPSSSEGFPLVLAESMARGTPFISTPVGAIPELVNQSGAGFLTPVGDAKSLAGRIGQLLTDKDLWSSMSLKARAFAQNFRWDRVAKEYYNTYMELAG